MATTFDFRISCGSAELDRADRLLERAHECVTRLEEELTEFKKISPVYQLNHAAPFERIQFTVDGFALLMRAVRLSKMTEAAFNPLAKSSTPSNIDVELAWDEETREVWKLKAGVHLGFGAIGKGFALDQVRLMLAQEGFDHFLLSGGGSSVFISGFQAPGVPWNWGWSWRKNEAGENLGLKMTHDTGRAVAIGVSGTHEKGSHIIGRSNSREEQNAPLKSALIAHGSATEADALSTGLYVLGWDQGVQTYSRSVSPIAMAAIDDSEVPHWNGLFQGLWKNLAQSFLSIGFCAFTTFMFVSSLLAHSTLADDAANAAANSGGEMDLSSLDAGTNTFTPYILERSNWWVLLPIFALIVVLIHLKKNKPRARRTQMNQPNGSSQHVNPNIRKIGTPLTTLFLASTCWLLMEHAKAMEVEPKGKAIMAVLGTKNAMKKVVGDTTMFYSKDSSGHVARAAFIQNGTWQAQCTHTWIVGIDGRTGTVTQVRPTDYSCPHAKPATTDSFLDQYKGKGPADVSRLSGEISTVAKATGTCNLTTDAVKKSIRMFQQVKGTL